MLLIGLYFDLNLNYFSFAMEESKNEAVESKPLLYEVLLHTPEFMPEGNYCFLC